MYQYQLQVPSDIYNIYVSVKFHILKEANEKIEVDVKYYECISSERSIEYMKIGHCHSCIADFGFVCFHLEMLFLITTCKNLLVQKYFFRF